VRVLFGCLAVLLGAVSIALAARYGYKGADTLTDGLISAIVFGLIALCAFLFDAAAVRLWFMGHRLGRGRKQGKPEAGCQKIDDSNNDCCARDS
jgi:hypothetical protein